MPPKTRFEEAPIESQLELFELVGQFLSIHVEVNRMGSSFVFPEYMTLVGEYDVRDVLRVIKEGWKTELARLGKVQFGIKTLETQIKEQKEMADLLKKCDRLSETAKQVSEDSSSGGEDMQAKRRQQLENCDKLEEHASNVLRACKRLKGLED